MVPSRLTPPTIRLVATNLPVEENEIIIDVIKAKFKSQGRSVGSEDDIKQEFEMFCLDIEYNIAH